MLIGVILKIHVLIITALCILMPIIIMALWHENKELYLMNIWIQRIIFIALIWVLTAFVIGIDNFGITKKICQKDQEETNKFFKSEAICNISLREYLYGFWVACVFTLIPLQLMILNLFKEYLDDLLITEQNLQRQKKGLNNWPSQRQQYNQVPLNEEDDESTGMS